MNARICLRFVDLCKPTATRWGAINSPLLLLSSLLTLCSIILCLLFSDAKFDIGRPAAMVTFCQDSDSNFRSNGLYYTIYDCRRIVRMRSHGIGFLVLLRARARACVRACVRAWVCVCVCVCVCMLHIILYVNFISWTICFACVYNIVFSMYHVNARDVEER